MTKRTIKDVAGKGKIPREQIASVVSAVHVTPINGSWQVRKTGKSRIAENFSTKKDAVEYARDISNKKEVDLIVHEKTVKN
ncbi:MAG: DUF2188 domain-containing protein [Aridibacter sp.]